MITMCSPAPTKEAHELRMCILQYLPQYFNAVEGCFHDLEGDGCLQRLTQHIEQSAGNKLLKMELTEEAMEALAIAEAEAIARLRALCAELSVYKMHFWLRDTLNERLWHDKLHPRKHTIYAWCDFADGPVDFLMMNLCLLTPVVEDLVIYSVLMNDM